MPLVVLVVTLGPTAGLGYQLPGGDGANDEAKSSERSTLSSGNTWVWLEERVVLDRYTAVILRRAVDETKVLLAPATLDKVTEYLREALASAQLLVPDENDLSTRSMIRLEPIITKYDAGSAGARWISPGLGATTCVIRAVLVDAASEEVVGEILSWRQVAAGGLFSLGADKYVPREAAEAVVEALVGEIRQER